MAGQSASNYYADTEYLLVWYDAACYNSGDDHVISYRCLTSATRTPPPPLTSFDVLKCVRIPTRTPLILTFYDRRKGRRSSITATVCLPSLLSPLLFYQGWYNVVADEMYNGASSIFFPFTLLHTYSHTRACYWIRR
jgi:hypothetical protein